MTSAPFYTSAVNFINDMFGGVSPRTGLFNVSLPLADLHSGPMAAPPFSLSLRYSPISVQEQGFGKGFEIGLTRYDTATGTLLLANGEQYRVDGYDGTVRQKKLNNFIFCKIDDQHFDVRYKSGIIEHLSLFDSVFVPTRIKAPDSRSARLRWNFAFDKPRLSEVLSDDGAIICEVEYPSEKVASTKITYLPEDAQAGYELILDFSEGYLVKLTSNAADHPLVWSFDYEDVGPKRNWRVVTGISYPTGLKEKISYYTDSGMKFPETAGLPPLPMVYEHEIAPGAGQPKKITRWSWTQKNYLGRDAGFNEWSPDADQMLNILLDDYEYGSTAAYMDAEGATELCTITRRYNSYHLLISEVSVRESKTHSTSTIYHAIVDKAFEEQPAQFALPKTKIDSLEDSNGVSSRSITTCWQFDDFGNLLTEEAPDGTRTDCEYYPANGQGSDCPPEPNGFVRFMKTKTVTPPRRQGDEPQSTTTHKWKKLNIAGTGVSYAVVLGTVIEQTANEELVTSIDYYEDDGDKLNFGREKKRTRVLRPGRAMHQAFISEQSITYKSSNYGFQRTITFVGHDKATATHSSLKHPYTGQLLAETNSQGITVEYARDKAGRMIGRTAGVGSAFESRTRWIHTFDNDGPITIEIDAIGNKKKFHFDGIGRAVRQQQLDIDNTKQWFDVWQRDFNELDELQSLSAYDHDTYSAQRYIFQCSAEYDGWGDAKTLTFSDGVAQCREVDPIQLRTISYVRTKAGTLATSSGTSITDFDALSGLPISVCRMNDAGDESLVRRNVWDGLGRLREQTDEVGNVTKRTYDSHDRLLSMSLPDGSIMTRTYAPHLTGNYVTAISVTETDAHGTPKTSLLGSQEFDSLARVMSRTVGGRTTHFHYKNAAPVPESITLATGATIAYEYIPELDNTLREVDAHGVSQHFMFDKTSGLKQKEVEGEFSVAYGRKSSGLLATETFLSDETKSEAQYLYTLSGELCASTDITGAQTIFQRDNLGRIVKILDPALNATLQYDAFGRLWQTTVKNQRFGHGLTTTLRYDDFSREISRAIVDECGKSVTLTSGWTDNDLLNSRILSGDDGQELVREVYDYDCRNRLQTYSVSGTLEVQDAYGMPVASQSFAYDAINNITKVSTSLKDGTADTATFHYSQIDHTQLVEVSHSHKSYPESIRLEYDGLGHLTRDEHQRFLTYDVLGRLTKLTGISADEATYQYDSRNRLVRQRASKDRLWEMYYHDAELIVLRTSTKPIRLIKTPHACVGIAEGDRLTLIGNDGKASPILAYPPDNTNATSYAWSPWGTGTPPLGILGFNGERVDPISGSYHLGNGYRAYSPTLMRFNRPDSLSPFGAGGINSYAYCNGDPVNQADPTGHLNWEGYLGITVGVVGLALAAFTAGSSLAAAGSIFAAAEASPLAAVVGTAGAIANVTGLASTAIQQSAPDASAVLGWVSLATGVSALAGGIVIPSSLYSRSSAAYSRSITFGGTMKDIEPYSAFYLFEDTYKGGRRLNISAHGMRQADGTAVIGTPYGRPLDADDLYEIIDQQRNLSDYSNLRTIMCFSGNGGSRSFGQRLATRASLPVKAYVDRVTANHEVESLNELFYNAATTHGNRAFSYLRGIFEQRMTFDIWKTNRHPFFSIDYFSWRYCPVKFTP